MAVKNHTFEDDGRTYYYMHRHLEHFEKSTAIDIFEQQRKQNYNIMRSRFVKNYLENINKGINENGLEILDAAMREEEVEKLDKQLLEILNDKTSEAIRDTKLDKRLRAAYTSLNDFINTQEAKHLDKLFAQITTATGLLTRNRKEIMALIGRSSSSNWKMNKDLTKLYSAMQQDFASWEGKVVSVNNSAMRSVETSLMKLVGDLSQGKFNKQTLMGYLKNIFSTKIGEYVVSKGVGKAMNLARGEIKKSLVGTKTIEVEDSEVEQMIKDYGQLGETHFTTDNSFQNLSITVKSGDTININLGLSTKWYKGTNSGKVYDVDFLNESGQGAFVNRIEQMINSEADKYYVYNALGLVQQDNSIYSALKAAIVARNLDFFISGFGKQGDFSQFLVINGNFYSIWQIISAVETLNKGQGSYGKGDATDPVTISATGLKAIGDATEAVKNDPSDLIAAYLRSKMQNRMIETKLGLAGHFYPNRLKNALISSK